jgi:hypothetical protein
MADESYMTNFDDMIPLQIRKRGWAIKISGTSSIPLSNCDTSMIDMQILLYVKFRVKLVRGQIQSDARPSLYRPIYIKSDTIKYNDWNVRVDAPFKDLRETYPYVVDDYPDPDASAGMGGINNSSIMEWNISPSLEGTIYLQETELFPKLWSYNTNLSIDTDDDWTLTDTITNNSVSFTLINSTSHTRLLDLDINSNQPWLSFRIQSMNNNKYVPNNTTLNGVIDYIDNDILGNVADLNGNSTSPDSPVGLSIHCNPTQIVNYNINNHYTGYLTLISPTSSNDSVRVEVRLNNINGQPKKFNTTGGGSYCAGGEGILVGLDSSEANVSYQLLLNNTILDTSVIGTGEAISFGYQKVSGSYTIIGRNIETNSLQTMDGNAIINIYPSPEKPQIIGTTSVCDNSTELYSVSDVSQTTIKWVVSGGTMLYPKDSLSQSINWGIAGTGSIKVVRTNITTGCSDSTLQSIIINPLPSKPNISDTSIVAGHDLTLTPKPVPNSIFLWYETSKNGSAFAISPSLDLFNLMNDTTVYVEAVDTTTSCISATRTKIIIDVRQAEELEITLISKNLEICEGDTILIGIDGEMTDGTPPFSYTWNPTDGLTNPTALPTQTTNYTLTVTDMSNRTGEARVSVIVNPVLETPVIKQQNDTLLATPGINFQWFLDNVLIANETSDLLIITQSGYYSVMAIDDKGCNSDTTEPAYFEYNPNAVENDINKLNKDLLNVFSLMPNPVRYRGSFKIEMKAVGELNLDIVDIYGQKIESLYSGQSSAGVQEFSFDVERMSNGTYFINAVALGFKKHIKFQVMK